MSDEDAREAGPDGGAHQGWGTESSLALLERACEGDAGALEMLLARYLPRLRRWASGRVPASARGMIDTDDIVQDTLVRAVRNFGGFEPRGESAFLAYCLEALRNRLRDEFRWGQARPFHTSLDESLASRAPSPLDSTLHTATFERYERALHTLTAEKQEAIVARFELGYSHGEVAALLGKSSAEAARKLIARAVIELASAMKPDA